ncbi:MAG: hypothetical protein K2P84_04345, partial [Undibacterium sp.]|nr:hypothetical protein [Undibacterium sp.]
MTTMNINSKHIVLAWQAFQQALPVKVCTIHSADHYSKMVSFMNGMIDVVGDQEDHELADFLDLIGQLVEDYDNIHHSIPKAAPHEVLRFLMEQHQLTQTDLAQEIGGQSVVSA